MRRVASFLLFLASPALAAPDDDAQKKLEALRDELQQVRAQLPSAVEALHALENRLESLTREVERLSAAREAAPFVQSAVDQLRSEMDQMERRVASTQRHVMELGEGGRFRLGYDEASGIFLETSPVTVWLSGGVMARWYGILRDGAPNDSNFDLHHGQIALRSEIIGIIDLQLMLDFGAEFLAAGPAGILRDAFLDVKPTSWLMLRAGQFLVPFGRQRLVYDFQQTFAERSLATRAFTFDRDLGGGVELAFLKERLLIQAAITDGVRAGQVTKNDNIDFAYTLRILGQPLGPVPMVEGDVARTRPPRFSIGAAFQYNLIPNDQKVDLNHDGVIDNVAVYSFDGELALKWRGLALEGEYFLRYEAPGAGLPHHLYQGMYGQGSAMLWRGLQLALRYSYAQPHALGGGKLGLFGDQPRWGLEAGGVLGYYLWREKVRVQLAYDYRREDATVTRKIEQGHVVQVQAQAQF
jgi:Phosphate-selective porin O and P